MYAAPPAAAGSLPPGSAMQQALALGQMMGYATPQASPTLPPNPPSGSLMEAAPPSAASMPLPHTSGGYHTAINQSFRIYYHQLPRGVGLGLHSWPGAFSELHADIETEN